MFPARVHAILAREAPVGIIIRRGPAKSVCTIGWDRVHDQFSLGQWMHGRIYERRCDLSPDGKHFLYFAMNGRWSSETRGTWTAISRTPYLKAITLFPKGDAWQGGGLFTSRTAFWLNGCHEAPLQSAPEWSRDEKYQPQAGFGAECLSAYYPRLLRDGWTLVERVSNGAHDRMDIFDKALPAGWVLRKFAYAALQHKQGTGHYWDEHELFHPKSGKVMPYPAWEWADRDGERLVWSTGGRLFGGTVGGGGIEKETELADFNGWQFEKIVAPY
jgi:hypothetical protein